MIVKEEVYRLQNVIDEQEKALLHWRREYDVLFQENNVLHNEVKRLLAEYTKLHDALLDGMASQIAKQYADNQMWDFVEEHGKAGPWVARHSTMGRGFRLHTTSDPYAWVDGELPVGIGETAREAVMDLYKKVNGR